MGLIRKLTAEDKEELARRVLDVHHSDPGRLRNVLPEVADLLDEYSAPGLVGGGSESPFGLTERERNFHKAALEIVLRQFKSLSSAQAVEGLEHGANLLVDDFTPGYP